MSAFTAAACRLLNYRCPIASLGIVRKARYIIPGNGFPCKISTTCNHFSNDDKSGVDPKQGVNKTPDVKAQIFTHDNAVFHDQICKSLFGDGAKNLFRMMSESKIRFQVVTGKDNIEVIATSDERLEQAKQIVEKEVEDIKSKLQMKPSANTSAYEEKVLLDWDPAVPKKQVKGRFIGVRGNNVRQLMNQFDSKVSIHWREDHVLIKGKDKELVKAATVQVKEQLKETVGELESSRLVEVVPTPAVQKHSFFTAKVDVPKENVNTIVGYIIGAKGRNIRHLGDQAGFGLTVSSGPDYVEVKVNDEANLEKAVQLVTKEIEAFKEKTFVVPTPAVQKHSFFTAKVDVPKENVKAIVGYIIGAKGRNIRHLGDQAGFSLTVSSGPDYVEVNVHDEANLEKAVQLVTKEIEAFKEKSFVVPTPAVQKHSFFTAKVDVQKENVKAIVGYIIGAQGRNIRHLEDQAGFSLTVSSGPDYIEVKVNDEANLEKAVQLVTKEIEDFEQKQIVVPTPAVQKHSFFTAKVDVQKENVNTIVGFIIGAKGRNIQHLEDQAGFSLTVSSGPDYIEVKVNDEANLEKAVQLVEKEIERIISSKSTVERRDTDGDPSRARTIQVDEGMDIIFRRLIGKGGSHVNYLRQQIGVDFSINKMDMSTIVVGVNNPGDLDVAVEGVTKEIEALKQNLSADNKDTAGDPSLSRVIPIDGSLDTLFGRLIGKKGDNVKRLREQIGVNFNINKMDTSTIVVGVNNPADLDLAVEGDGQIS
ncbi:Insulin-like growth factor 2 mRNA-binding protein 2 [Mizuhopecten yessoensis]|uniref:Insulin-like growth factor 2 mRNA-binding protein 2 n=1 Tax=Mizuhopecten yessoensis TaxID=6573 RepID=A0A210Q7T9_MIZYE|nr:Insulin-like growth factor 2 mRNA-binding protein 2 [Mizuhopecten yessoensis]